MEKNKMTSNTSASNQTRRRVLKSAATVGLLASASSVSARKKEKTDFQEQLTQAIQEDGAEGMEQLMKDQERAYDLNTVTVGNSDSENTGVSTQTTYDESEATLTTMVAESSYDDLDGTVWLTGLMEFGGTYTYNDRKPWDSNDAIGLTFDSDHWSVVGTPTLTSDEHDPSWHSGSPSANDEALVGEVDIKKVNPTYSLPHPPHDTQVSIMCKLQHQGGSYSTVWSHYDHTKALTGTGSIDVTASAGVFEVDVKGGVVAWSEAEPGDPAKAFS